MSKMFNNKAEKILKKYKPIKSKEEQPEESLAESSAPAEQNWSINRQSTTEELIQRWGPLLWDKEKLENDSHLTVAEKNARERAKQQKRIQAVADLELKTDVSELVQELVLKVAYDIDTNPEIETCSVRLIDGVINDGNIVEDSNNGNTVSKIKKVKKNNCSIC